MTALSSAPPVRAAGRFAGAVIAIVSGVVGLLVIGARTLSTFTGGGADPAHHYALVYWFSHHWTLPPADGGLDSMARYPPGAHVLAALVGRIVDSPFRGMQLVAIAAVVLIWLAIGALLSTLPGRRRWVALGALAAILALNTSAGPFRLQPHGFELIGNFFLSQVLGQAVVWWLVLLAVRRRIAGRPGISTALLIAVAAVLATSVHVLPAVELLVVVGCLSAAELLERWRTGRRTLRTSALPILLPAATAVAVVLTPGFRAMQKLAENDGSLEVPYLSGLASYLGVAAAVAVVSLVMIVASRRQRDDVASAAVLQGVGFAGLAVAAPCAVQAVALAGGEGSPYAVKKYIFGLLTVLIVAACVAVALLVRRQAIDGARLRPGWHVAAPVALTVVATLSVFSHPGSRYSMSQVTTLERQVVGAATAAGIGTGGDDYAVALPQSHPLLDYMFSLGVLATPLDQAIDEHLRPILQGESLRLRRTSGDLITAVGSPYDISTCRRFGPQNGLVVADAACWMREAHKCEAVNVLGHRGRVADLRLRGFSLAEPTGRWTDGRRASFSCVFPGNRPLEPITIELDATAFLPPGVARQRVTLAAGRERKDFVLTPQKPHAVLHVAVPPPTPPRLTVTLTLPDAVSPEAAGLGPDARQLGVFISEIRVG